MDLSPPTKPPRGVKPIKETSGLLMSVIRTLSASETNEQRDREKAKLENDYKICDQKIDELVSRHGFDLSKVMQLFVSLSEIVTTNRGRIENVRENLQDCKKKLRCRKDELKNLWIEGLEYKYMLHLLDEIEKMNKVPNCLSLHMERKQYLNATMLLVDAVCLGKGMLEGVETLKDLSLELEQKKEELIQIHQTEGITESHVRTRNVVERCIGVLKAYFRCLRKDRVLHYKPDTAAKIIYACAILHNILRERNIIDDDLEHNIEDGIEDGQDGEDGQNGDDGQNGENLQEVDLLREQK
ncbi:hypothetical protein JTB14_003891 [Gonioctena quinquepunctata]|nr:hypothetical protein JTB14_003891 [Gonioctena quinquepunctata]